jgi:hypothetical protein
MGTPTFRELLEMTGRNGRQAFRFASGDPMHRCIDCDAVFPQTDEGWKDLHQHGMDHGRPASFEWQELNGRTLRIQITSRDHQYAYKHDGHENAPEVDVYAIDDSSGEIFHIATVCDEWKASYSRTGTKWKVGNLKKRENGQKLTPLDRALRLIGFASTDEK